MKLYVNEIGCSNIEIFYKKSPINWNYAKDFRVLLVLLFKSQRHSYKHVIMLYTLTNKVFSLFSSDHRKSYFNQWTFYIFWSYLKDLRMCNFVDFLLWRLSNNVNDIAVVSTINFKWNVTTNIRLTPIIFCCLFIFFSRDQWQSKIIQPFMLVRTKMNFLPVLDWNITVCWVLLKFIYRVLLFHFTIKTYTKFKLCLVDWNVSNLSNSRRGKTFLIFIWNR